MEEKLRLKIRHRRMLIRRCTIGFSAVACLAVGFFAVRSMFLTTSSVPGDNCSMPNLSQEAYYRSGDSSLECLDSLIIDRNYDKALTFADSLINESKLELTQ